jgi:acyloxyacyl hydrolase
MSNASFGWICLLVIVFIPVIDGGIIPVANGVNGGVDCATCSIVLGLVDKLSIVYNETIVHTLERLCSFLPGDYGLFCKVAVEFLGKFIR